MFGLGHKKRIYLDYAAATPVRKEVIAAMERYWRETFGNAGAIHQEGVLAHTAIEESRRKLASVLHVREEGITFTSGGTESNNLAIFGTLRALHAKGTPFDQMEVISTAIEHPSVKETLKEVAKLGVSVIETPVDEDGRIDMTAYTAHLSSKTVLVTLAYANSEIGVIQDISKISRIAKEKAKEFGTHIVIHVDAAQAPLWLSCELDRIGADLLSLDAGKCYGPKGVGVLARKHGIHLLPYFFGGAQEAGLRPGTENTALIVGGVCALEIAQKHFKTRSERVEKLRDYFIDRVCALEGVLLNGTKEERIANNINVSIPGIDSEFAAIVLDSNGIACSTKSACGGAKGDGSQVVRTITKDEGRAHSTLRFTLGEENTKSEIERVVHMLASHIDRMRPFAV